MSVTVYKLGGSLLDLPDLGARVQRVISARPESRPLIVVGGGRAADLVREWDRIHRLGEVRSHWLALRAMRLNESLVAGLLENGEIIVSRDEANAAWNTRRVPVLGAFEFLRREEATMEADGGRNDCGHEDASRGTLPSSWDVTSDSIAAWTALRWPAVRLVLLKSVGPPDGFSAGTIASADVDRHFSRVIEQGRVELEWVNLRRTGGG